MALALDLSAFVQHHDDGAAHMELAVEGIVGATSLRAIGAALLPGIARARVNFTNRRLFVEWTDQTFDPARIVDALAALGHIPRIHLLRVPERMSRPPRRAGFCVALRSRPLPL